MAVTAKWYGQAFVSAFNAEVDFDGGAVKVMLCDSTYTPDQDVHRYLSSVSGEVVGSGYTAGGQTLTTPAVTYDGPTNVLALNADDSLWTPSTITARYAVVYVDSGTPATSPLLCFVDFGQDMSSSAGDFLIEWDASGIARVTVTA